MRAIPREKREDDVAREQQRSKHAIRDASVEAAGLKRKREEQYEKAKQQRKLEGKGPGRPPAVRGPVKQHTAPPVQPQQHDSSTAARKEKSRRKMGHSRKGNARVRPGQMKRNAGTCNSKPCKLAAGGLRNGVCAMRNAFEKALRTSIAAQLGVRNGKLFPLKGVRKPRAMHSNNS